MWTEYVPFMGYNAVLLSLVVSASIWCCMIAAYIAPIQFKVQCCVNIILGF